MKTETDRSALASPEPDGSGKKRNPILRFLGEMPGLIIMSLILAILIKTFLIQAFYIPSQSMEDTLRVNDRVLVSKVPYYFRDPKARRRDRVLRARPGEAAAAKLHRRDRALDLRRDRRPEARQPRLHQAVIGVPGDTVYAKHDQVYVNGVPIDEPYVKGTTGDFPTGDVKKVTVPPNMYFVIGDNRRSRWTHGSGSA